MITLFNRTETNFTHNGICVLDNYIIEPKVTEELNGMFMLEFGYHNGSPNAQAIRPERIIRCAVPNMPAQLFRIALVQKELSGITRYTAYHVFYDLADNLVEDTFVINRGGQEAVRQILNATQFAHGFTATSNISTITSARIVRYSPAEVLLNPDMDNGFLARWGGEIIRDNFHISMRNVRGSDNGVAIRDRKNLTGYTSDVDFNSVVTRIMPQGFDGLFLPERYVDSTRINQYTRPKIRVIRFESIRAEELGLSQAHVQLRAAARREFTEHRIDVPQASYSIEFAPLANTEEYKNFASLETVHIGDTVTVIHEADGFEITARVMAYTYNPMTDAYISITLGNYTPKFTNIAQNIRRIETAAIQAQEFANFALQSANGKNTNFYGTAQPANPRPGDLWFRENGDKLELWIFEEREGVLQWFPLATDLTWEQMRAELEEARELVAEASRRAGLALEAGESAGLAAEAARQKGEAAQSAADDAKAAGQETLEVGQQAQEAGQSAQNAANQARDEAQDALERANDAFDNALTAVTQAEEASSRADDAFGNSLFAVDEAGLAFRRSIKRIEIHYALEREVSGGVFTTADGAEFHTGDGLSFMVTEGFEQLTVDN